MTRQVREFASARCGDKGNTLNAVVVADDPEAYDLLADRLTADRVKSELDDVIEGPVTRYDLPESGIFNFVMEDALAGGVTRSLRIDPHGKSMSYAVLGIEIEAGEYSG